MKGTVVRLIAHAIRKCILKITLVVNSGAELRIVADIENTSAYKKFAKSSICVSLIQFRCFICHNFWFKGVTFVCFLVIFVIIIIKITIIITIAAVIIIIGLFSVKTLFLTFEKEVQVARNGEGGEVIQAMA